MREAAPAPRVAAGLLVLAGVAAVAMSAAARWPVGRPNPSPNPSPRSWAPPVAQRPGFQEKRLNARN